MLFVTGLKPALAQAHTSLLFSSPKSGEVISHLPNQVILTFGDRVEEIAGEKVNQVSVVSQTGELLNSAPMKISATKILQPIKMEAAEGLITVYFRVSAFDGHIVEGSYVFYNKVKIPENSSTKRENSRNSISTNAGTHQHDQSTKTQKAIYTSSTFLVLFGFVWGVWYYRKKSKNLL